MKFEAGRDGILEALQIVTRITKGKITLPILGNVLMTMGPTEEVLIAATDLDIILGCHVRATIAEPGSITASAKVLQSLIKGLPKEDMTITSRTERDGSKPTVVISCGRSEFRVPAVSADEFPSISPEVEELHTVSLLEKDLAILVRSVETSISEDDTRYALHGAQMMATEDRLRLTSTDSHRLVTRSAPLLSANLDGQLFRTPLIPKRAIEELGRILNEKSEEPVRITWYDRSIRFDIGHVYLQARLTEGHYPDWTRLVPQQGNGDLFLRFSRNAAEKGLKQIHITAQDGHSRIAIRPHMTDELARAHADTQGTESVLPLRFIGFSEEMGKAVHVLEATLTGEPRPIGININYLIDALKIVEGRHVTLETSGVLSPILVYSGDPKDGDMQIVVMPMDVGAFGEGYE